MNQSIMQWNCRGLRATSLNYNYCLVNLILKLYVCKKLNFQLIQTSLCGFSDYHFNAVNNKNSFPSGGLTTFVQNSVPHSSIALNTPLQAQTVGVST